MEILAAFASEITFLISFLLIYFIARLIHFIYSLIHLRNFYIWMMDGIITGICSIFAACYISNLITHSHNDSEITIILLAITLPLIGEIGYYRYLAKNVKTYFVSRLHLAMKNPIQRGEFAYNEEILIQKALSENRGDELKNEEAKHALRQKAYDMTQGVLAYLTMWNWIGYIIGLFLVHHYIF